MNLHSIVSHIYDVDILNMGEWGAINEAFADYFSCNYWSNPVIGLYSLPVSDQRNLDGHNKFPDDYNGQKHHDSLIYSQALWDIRQDPTIRSNAANQLIYQSLYFEPDTFNTGMEALLTVDDNLYGGKHKNAILNAFAKHGIPNNNNSFAYNSYDTYDLNNDFQMAFPIDLGSTYHSYISSLNDLDFYKLTLTPENISGKLIVTLELPLYGKDFSKQLYYVYCIALFNQMQQKIKEFQFSANTLEYINDSNYTVITAQKKLQLKLLNLTPGIYYILVFAPFNGLAPNNIYHQTYSTFVPYSLSAEISRIEKKNSY